MWRLITLALLVSALPSAVSAQDVWPTRPVKITIGAPAGGATDQIIRPVAEALSAKFGQSFLIDPRPGAGGNIAAEATAKAPGDGYTLTVSTMAPFGIGPSLYKTLAFDAVKDFKSVAKLADFANVIYVHPTSPFKTLKDLLEFAKANPGKVNYGSTGVGTSLHLTGVMLSQEYGITLTHVPYKGSAPLMTAVLSREIDVAIDNLPGSLGQIKGGTLRALAVTTAERSPFTPDVPAVSELIPGFAVASWFGLSAPAAVPDAIVKKLADEVARIQATSELKERYATVGATVSVLQTSQFDEYVRKEIARWAPIVKASGASVD